MSETKEEVKTKDLIKETEVYIYGIFEEKFDARYTYHDIQHTLQTVQFTEKIAEKEELKEEDVNLVVLAAWFHDAGYWKDYQNHEEEGAKMAREFLRKQGFPEEKIATVESLINSTTLEHEPTNHLEKVLHDADLVNIGKKRFFYQSELLRIEWENCADKKFTDEEWEQLQLNFLVRNSFYTNYCIRKFGERRAKNIKKQRKSLDKAQSSASKEKKARRGTETMYRSAYRNHINLSSIADSKANMMISINTIIMTIIITAVGSGFTFTGKSFIEHIRFTVPLVVLLLTSLISIIFAILSANPKVTNKKVDKKKIENNETSILFFGNFVNLPLNEFINNVANLRNKKEALYDNMTIDLYFLGKVLTKKYRLLRFSYTTFMSGLIIAVVIFFTILFYTGKTI